MKTSNKTKELALSDKQSTVVESSLKILENKATPNLKDIKFVSVNSVPGSGKSTTIMALLNNYINKAELIEDVYVNSNEQKDIYLQGKDMQNILELEDHANNLVFPNQEKKVLVLTFNKKITQDVYKKSSEIAIDCLIDSQDVQNSKILKQDYLSKNLNISTYHSLLLKSASSFIEEFGFKPDYAKGAFYKKDIKTALHVLKLDKNIENINFWHKAVNEFHSSALNIDGYADNYNTLNAYVGIDAAQMKEIVLMIYALMKAQHVTMPHCYYYKAAYDKAINDKEFLNKIFSDEQGNPYSFVVVDEAQDSNEMIFDLIVRSNLKSVFVGDNYQNIYGFLGTFNIFDALAGKHMHETLNVDLTQSFRFGKSIASLASLIPVDLTNDDKKLIPMEGVQKEDATYFEALNIKNIKNLIGNIVLENEKSKLPKKVNANRLAIITRTNARAFELFAQLRVDENIGKHVRIDSGIKDDIKKFFKDGIGIIKDGVIKDAIIQCMGKSEFTNEELFENSGACSILAKSEYSYILKVKDEKAREAINSRLAGNETITIITVHRSKGLEYEFVILADDYIKENKNDLINEIEAILEKPKLEFSNDADSDFSYMDEYDNPEENTSVATNVKQTTTKPSSQKSEAKKSFNDEEVNIIYTAATRAKKYLMFMEGELPKSLESSIEAGINNSDDNLVMKLDAMLLDTPNFAPKKVKTISSINENDPLELSTESSQYSVCNENLFEHMGN